MELMMGLEQSKQKFIWLLREANRGDIFTGEARKLELPEGYDEKSKRERVSDDRISATTRNLGSFFHRRVHESLRMEFLHREHYYGGAYSWLAYAF
ncbi:hypothetical protein P3S68_030973 [Capsicum galapagoense]